MWGSWWGLAGWFLTLSDSRYRDSGSFPRPGAAAPPRCGLGAPPLPSSLTGNSRPRPAAFRGSGPDGAARPQGCLWGSRPRPGAPRAPWPPRHHPFPAALALASRRRGEGRTTGAGGGTERGAVPSPAAATVLSREHGLRPRLCTGNAWPQCGPDSPRSRGRPRSAATPSYPMEWFAPRPGPASEGTPRPPFCAAARGSGRYAAEPVRVSGTRRSLPWPVSGARRARSGPTRAH